MGDTKRIAHKTIKTRQKSGVNLGQVMILGLSIVASLFFNPLWWIAGLLLVFLFGVIWTEKVGICENCGNDVPEKSKMCKICGSWFSY